MSDSFPIDITYNQLLTWLKERYLIPKDWPTRLEVIKSKSIELSNLINEKDDKGEFKKAKEIINSPLDYDSCKRLQSILMKTEEAKQKTLFGNYSSPIIYTMNLIINLYEKENIFLCEISKNTTQDLDYEIINIEKEIHTSDKNVSEYESKIKDRDEQQQNVVDKLDKTLNEYGINNQEIKKLLIKIISEKSICQMDLKKSYISEIETKLKEIAFEVVKDMYELPDYNKSVYLDVNDERIKSGIKYYKHFFSLNNLNSDTVLPNLNSLINLKDYQNIYDLESSTIKEKSNFYNLNFKNITVCSGYLSQIKNYEIQSNDDCNKLKESLEMVNKEISLLNPNFRKSIINELNELKNFLLHRSNNVNSKIEINLGLYTNLDCNSEFTFDKINSCLDFCKKLIADIVSNEKYKFRLKTFQSEKQIYEFLYKLENVFELIFKLKQEIETFKDRINQNMDLININKKKFDEIKKNLKNNKKLVDKTLTTLLKRKVNMIGSKHLF